MKSKKKLFEPGRYIFIVNKNMPKYTDPPYWIEKDERSKAFIEKYGLPGMPPPQKEKEVSEDKE